MRDARWFEGALIVAMVVATLALGAVAVAPYLAEPDARDEVR